MFGAIFDMDGVLVDSTEAHFASWRRIGEEAGIAYPREIFNRTFGMANLQSIPIWLGRDVSEEECQEFGQRKEALYRTLARQSLKPIPGVVELVKALAAENFHLAVGSSGPRANVQLALDVIGLTDCFEALATGDDVKEGKPHPAIFLNAARKMGVPPSRCAVFEDAPPGIEAGRAAGMAVIAIPTSRDTAELSGAHWVAGSLHDVTPQKVRELIQ